MVFLSLENMVCGLFIFLRVNAGFTIKDIVHWVKTSTLAKNIMGLSLNKPPPTANLQYEVIWPGIEPLKKLLKKQALSH